VTRSKTKFLRYRDTPSVRFPPKGDQEQESDRAQRRRQAKAELKLRRAKKERSG
jgi:hypothetical protein